MNLFEVNGPSIEFLENLFRSIHSKFRLRVSKSTLNRKKGESRQKWLTIGDINDAFDVDNKLNQLPEVVKVAP